MGTRRDQSTRRDQTGKSGQAAIEGLAGEWLGERNETYVVDEFKWSVDKILDGERRVYHLKFDPDSGIILWGAKFFFDPSDLAEEWSTISWYRTSDERKRKSAFTWWRSEGGGTERAERSSVFQKVTREAAASLGEQSAQAVPSERQTTPKQNDPGGRAERAECPRVFQKGTREAAAPLAQNSARAAPSGRQSTPNGHDPGGRAERAERSSVFQKVTREAAAPLAQNSAQAALSERQASESNTKTAKKKEKTPEEIQAARHKEEIAQKKKEDERRKREEDLAAKRKVSEEARLKALEQARKEAERRAELAEEAKRKEESELLQRVEEQRKKQEDLNRKRLQSEERARQEMLKKKQQKTAAINSAAIRTASAVRKKKGGTSDDGKKPLEAKSLPQQVLTPGDETENLANSAAESDSHLPEELNMQRSLAIRDPDPRPSLTVVLVGDALARQRLSANLLFLTGAWDRSQLEQFQQEECNASAAAIDSGSAEAGTSHVRCRHITTTARRFVLLDSPGPTDHMPTAIACAAQAHAAVLLVPAQEAELASALEAGRGPIWQHAAVLQALGVIRIIVAIEGMEDPGVSWRRERFEEVQSRVMLLFQSLGAAAVPAVVPVSNMMRSFLRDRHSEGAWFKGQTLLELLSALPLPLRTDEGSTCFLPLETCIGRSNVQVIGSAVRGVLRPGMRCKVVPSQQECALQAITSEGIGLTSASAGELVTLKVSDLKTGRVGQHETLCTSGSMESVRCVTKIRATLYILQPAADKTISAGFGATLCARGVEEECTLLKLTEGIDLETSEKLQSPLVATKNTFVVGILQMHRPVAFTVFGQSGASDRFVLRLPEEGTIIALGKVIELPKELSCSANSGT